MKAKREHEVPLSDAALAALGSMPRVSDVVFAGTKGQPLSDMSLTTVIRRMNGDDGPVWADANGNRTTVHGLRATFCMWAAETTNYPREVAEHALAQRLPDAVRRAYQRGSQFAKRAAMMTEWGVYCATVQTDTVVKPIRGAAQIRCGNQCCCSTDALFFARCVITSACRLTAIHRAVPAGTTLPRSRGRRQSH